MTPAELLDALYRAGGVIEIEEGKPRLRGTRLPDALRTELHDQRAAVLAELERRPPADRQRWGTVPPAEAPMQAEKLALPEPWKAQILAHVLRQPRPVHAFVMRRANDYFARGIPADGCEWRACIDVIAWQRMNGGLAAARFLVELPSAEEIRGESQINKQPNERTK